MSSSLGASDGTIRRRGVLSRRQFECLQGVADHLSSDQIAHRLGISKHTVDSHIAAAVELLGAASRRDAVIRYLGLQREHPEKITGDFLRVAIEPELSADRAAATVVREEATPSFEHHRNGAPARGRAGHDLITILKISSLIVVLAFGLALLLIAADPLMQSAGKLANFIRALRHAASAFVGWR